MVPLLAEFLLVSALYYFLYHLLINPRNLPPSPRSLPLIGHVHLLRGASPHEAFARLSRRYGDIILVWLGVNPAIVISSPELARKVLRDLDYMFASRPYTVTGQYAACNKGMGMVPYNDHWRNMRKLCTTELFTARRIESFLGVRLEELSRMLTAVLNSCRADQPVNVRSMVNEVTFNTMTRILMSKRFFRFKFGSDDESSVDEEPKAGRH